MICMVSDKRLPGQEVTCSPSTKHHKLCTRREVVKLAWKDHHEEAKRGIRLTRVCPSLAAVNEMKRRFEREQSEGGRMSLSGGGAKFFFRGEKKRRK